MATKKKSNKSSSKKKSKDNHIPNFKGHYCRVCDTYKANEKFSGRGHNTHICKACSSMPPAEQAQELTTNRLMRMGGRYINKEEMKWLKNRMKDRRPEVKSLANDIFEIKFPHHRRNEIKKTLKIISFDFRIHSEIMDEYGDEYIVNAGFTADTSGKIIRKTYGEDKNIIDEQSVEVGQAKIRKIFNYMVNNDDICFWDEDLCGKVPNDDFDIDELYDGGEEDYDDEIACESDEIGEEENSEEQGELYWSVDITYKNGREQHIKNYSEYVPQEVNSLYDDSIFILLMKTAAVLTNTMKMSKQFEQ